ncbi:unnamed protein product [Sphagnum balticum]
MVTLCGNWRIGVPTLLITIVAWYLGTDPLHLSIARGIKDFKPQYLAPAPFDVLANLCRDNESKLHKKSQIWKVPFLGPESFVFDSQGRGPYTSVSDGRIVRYDGPELGWSTFAYTSKNRSEICAPKDPPASNLAFEHVCGRPLGLRFNKKTGELWIADAYLGILKVGPEGGQTEAVVTHIDGVPMKLCNDLDFDDDGILYFTDSSTRWTRRQFFLATFEGDNTGRFIKYDPVTKETTTLIKDLRFSNGVAVSRDGTFVLICDARNGRLVQYWLQGEKAGMHHTFVILPGWPDNVRCNEEGDFWVALHSVRYAADTFLGTLPWLRYLLGRLPVPQKLLYQLAIGKPHAMILRYDPEGNLKEVLEDQTGQSVQFVSEVEEHNGKLYIGSVLLPQIAVYPLQ